MMLNRPLAHTFFFTLVVGFVCVRIPPAQAETLRSNSYSVEFGNFNMTAGQKSSSSYTVTDTVGQTGAQEFAGTGYLVKAGFQYIYPFHSFSLKLSSLHVDFGTVTPNTFSTASHMIIVDADGAGGYVVKAAESHPLRLQQGVTTIADTTCDNGLCTESSAQSWTTATNTGFGFTLSGNDVAADFVSTNYFRQFANLAGAETAQTIMSRSTSASNRTATITYKISPSGSQAAGQYETTILFTAIPTY